MLVNVKYKGAMCTDAVMETRFHMKQTIQKHGRLETSYQLQMTYIDVALRNVTCQTATSMNLSFSSQCPSYCEAVITEKLRNETGSIGKKFLSSEST
jgi:hypothetical protein